MEILPVFVVSSAGNPGSYYFKYKIDATLATISPDFKGRWYALSKTCLFSPAWNSPKLQFPGKTATGSVFRSLAVLIRKEEAKRFQQKPDYYFKTTIFNMVTELYFA